MPQDPLQALREAHARITRQETPLGQLEDFAAGQGAHVTSKTGGRHNPGSAHYAGRALDLRTKDRTPAEVAEIMQAAEAEGYGVLDERQRPAGQKVWGGPHLHVEADELAPLRKIHRQLTSAPAAQSGAKATGPLRKDEPTDAPLDERFNWRAPVMPQVASEPTPQPDLKNIRVDWQAAQRQLQRFSDEQMSKPATTRERLAETFQASLAQRRAEREAERQQLEAEGQKLGTGKRLARKLALPTAAVATGLYSLPATMLRTNPSIDPALLEKTLGGYGRSVDAAQAALQKARTKTDALPADASLLEKGASVTADVAGQLVPIIAASTVMSPIAAAGGAGFLQTLGQGGTPTEAAEEAAFGAAGAAAGAGAAKAARGGTSRLASRLQRELAGRTLTSAAGAGAGLLEADLRDLDEEQAATTATTYAALGALFYGGARPKVTGRQPLVREGRGRTSIINLERAQQELGPELGQKPVSAEPVKPPAARSRPAAFKVDSVSHDEAALSERIGQPVTHDQLARLAGAPDGAEVRAQPSYYYGAGDEPRPAIHISVFRAENSNQQRILYRDAGGKLVLYNDQLQKPRGANPGWGAEVLARQIEEARRLGVDRIEAWATGQPGGIKNGYYTLARWGFDGELPAEKLRTAPEGLRAARTLQELFARPGGAEWWKRNGKPLAVTFDLQPGSQSERVFRNYLAGQPPVRRQGATGVESETARQQVTAAVAAETEPDVQVAALRRELGELQRRLNEPDANHAELHAQLDAVEAQARQLVNERMPGAKQKVRERELQRLLLEGQEPETVIGAARRKAERAGRDVEDAEWRQTEQELRALLETEAARRARIVRLEEQLQQFDEGPPPQSRRAEWHEWWDAKEVAARERLKQRFAPNVTHDITDFTAALPDLAVIGSAKMAKGAIRFADWSAAMLRDYGEEIRPHLRTIFDESAKLYAQAQPANRAALHKQLNAAQRSQQGVQTKLAKRLAGLDHTAKLETLAALRKAGLLTGVKTHLRNLGGNTAFQAVEEVARIPASIADLAVSAVTGQRTITGPDPLAVARSAREAATRGVREAWEILKTGAPTEQQTRQQLREIRSGSRILDAYVNGVFRTLVAEDRLFKVYAYTRALEDRARAQALTELRQGRIERSRGAVAARTREIVAQPSEALVAEAIGYAEVATFNNLNRGAAALQAGRQKLGAGGRFAVDLVVPFINTPSNIIARTLEYAGLGYAENAKQLADAIANRAFTPEAQRAFARTFGRATTGSAGLITLGWKLAASGMLTGLSSEDPRDRARDKLAGRPPLALQIGDRWYQVMAFAPVGTLLGIGASLYEAAHGQAQKPAEELLGTTGKVLFEQPLLRGTKEVTDALAEPGRLSDKAGRLVGSFVPTIISDTGAALDDVRRRPHGFVEHVQNRLPVLREQLPAQTDAFGQPLETRPTDFFDPFLSRPAREAESPLTGELTRLGVGITPAQKRRNERPDDYEKRRVEIGRLFNRYGAALVASQEWRAANDEERKAALAYLLSEAKAQSGQAVNEERFNPVVLLEGRKRRKQEGRNE